MSLIMGIEERMEFLEWRIYFLSTRKADIEREHLISGPLPPHIEAAYNKITAEIHLYRIELASLYNELPRPSDEVLTT